MTTKLGNDDFSVIIHGKYKHEETRATFSHSIKNSPSVVVKDIEETKKLCEIITGERNKNEFYEVFAGKYSENFNVDKDLIRVGVVNQTTMLATETQEIADMVKNAVLKKYGKEMKYTLNQNHNFR